MTKGPTTYIRLSCSACAVVFTFRIEQGYIKYCPQCAEPGYISQLEPDESWVESQAHKYNTTPTMIAYLYNQWQLVNKGKDGISWHQLLTGQYDQ